MKRYLTFAGNSFYAEGGWLDFIRDFDTQSEAESAGGALTDFDWWHVVDSHAGKIVASKPGEYCGNTRS